MAKKTTSRKGARARLSDDEFRTGIAECSGAREALRKLGISSGALYTRMKHLGITPPWRGNRGPRPAKPAPAAPAGDSGEQSVRALIPGDLNVSTLARVSYRHKEQQLEVGHPGGDPGLLRLAVDGETLAEGPQDVLTKLSEMVLAVHLAESARAA